MVYHNSTNFCLCSINKTRILTDVVDSLIYQLPKRCRKTELAKDLEVQAASNMYIRSFKLTLTFSAHIDSRYWGSH